jgi:hypothetical protein
MIVFLLCLILLAIVWPDAFGAILGGAFFLMVWAFILGLIVSGVVLIKTLIAG